MTKAFLNFAWDLACYIVLLFFVWKHAHWSVSIALTAMCSRFVLEDLLSRLRKIEVAERLDLFERRIAGVEEAR